MSYRIPQFSKIKFSDTGSESENFSDGTSPISQEILQLRKVTPKRTQSWNTKSHNKFSDGRMRKKLSSKDITESLNLFFHEEMLVLYYVSIGIRLCKLSDCRKAIKEYSKKENLSSKARGHLYQFQGLLALMNSKADREEVEDNFKTAIIHFEKAKCHKGKAICKLGLLKTKLEFNNITSPLKIPPTNKPNLSDAINEIKNLRNELSSINFTLGLERLEKIEEGLNPKQTNLKTSLKKFIRFKTLNNKYISELSQEDNHFDQNVLFNEDIILFTTVVENDPIVRAVKTSASCSRIIIPNDRVRKLLKEKKPVISISIIPEEDEVILNYSSFDARDFSGVVEKRRIEQEKAENLPLKDLPGSKKIKRHKKNLLKFGYKNVSKSQQQL